MGALPAVVPLPLVVVVSHAKRFQTYFAYNTYNIKKLTFEINGYVLSILILKPILRRSKQATYFVKEKIYILYRLKIRENIL